MGVWTGYAIEGIISGINRSKTNITVLIPFTSLKYHCGDNVGAEPNHIIGAMLHDLDHIYVSNAGSGTLYVIDTIVTNMIDTTIDVGKGPVYMDKAEFYIYLANRQSNTISVIDPNTNTVNKTIVLGESPTHLRYENLF